MSRKCEKPEDIVLKLRQIEVLRGQGVPVADAMRQVRSRSRTATGGGGNTAA